DILHPLAPSRSNVLVAGAAPHGARHGDLNSGRRIRHPPIGPTPLSRCALSSPRRSRAAIVRQPDGTGSAQIRRSIAPKQAGTSPFQTTLSWPPVNALKRFARFRAWGQLGASSGRLTSSPLTVDPITRPGQLCLVTMWLTAPVEPGSYYAAWKMVDDSGNECFP